MKQNMTPSMNPKHVRWMLRTLFFLNANTKNLQEEEKQFLAGTG